MLGNTNASQGGKWIIKVAKYYSTCGSKTCVIGCMKEKLHTTLHFKSAKCRKYDSKKIYHKECLSWIFFVKLSFSISNCSLRKENCPEKMSCQLSENQRW